MYKVLEIAANHAFETTHYNMTGKSMNPALLFQHQAVHFKKVRDFFLKNETFKAFLEGIDRKDERHILPMVKA